MAFNIQNNLANHHFELEQAGQTAFIDYKIKGDALVVYHTEVPQELEGQGIGSALIKYALNYAIAQKLGLIPLCPFMRAYLQKHPEYNYLVRKLR